MRYRGTTYMHTSEAHLVAAIRLASNSIDAVFGEGYAIKNPLLVAQIVAVLIGGRHE